ncbi:uncharacterized protein LOC121050402 [Rosa chinensis]|uniref:uncharacterized protein LOC121050402 n=1 Tax=Rosa chinensis TaxID=74649 RepID=UPI001AD906A8|nr:uncharacterized protein LOC121050402 [Rosa chinensis]
MTKSSSHTPFSVIAARIERLKNPNYWDPPTSPLKSLQLDPQEVESEGSSSPPSQAFSEEDDDMAGNENQSIRQLSTSVVQGGIPTSIVYPTATEGRSAELALLVKQVVSTKGQGTMLACGMCSMQGHMTDQCPQLIDNGGWESLNAIGGYQWGPQRPRYDPYSNIYNPGWRDHPNFKWTNNDNIQNPLGGNFQRPQGIFQRPYQTPQQASGNSYSNYDKTFEALTSSMHALI